MLALIEHLKEHRLVVLAFWLICNCDVLVYMLALIEHLKRSTALLSSSSDWSLRETSLKAFSRTIRAQSLHSFALALSVAASSVELRSPHNIIDAWLFCTNILPDFYFVLFICSFVFFTYVFVLLSILFCSLSFPMFSVFQVSFFSSFPFFRYIVCLFTLFLLPSSVTISKNEIILNWNRTRCVKRTKSQCCAWVIEIFFPSMLYNPRFTHFVYSFMTFSPLSPASVTDKYNSKT
jgi:hypothetical protein